MILVVIYGIFQHALRLRDTGDRHVRSARLRERAELVIRTDLRNALVSGGILASVFSGDSTGTDTNTLTQSNSGAFPGYLKFTTTTGRDSSTALYGVLQQVEYYIVPDSSAPGNGAGVLTRTITRDLLDADNTSTASQALGSITQEPILSGVQSFQVSFYDGTNWQTSWQFVGLSSGTGTPSPSASPSSSSTGGSATVLGGETGLPDAVRIDIQQAPPTPQDPPPPPLEILVPWTTQPFAAATPATGVSTAASPTPTPTPTPTPAPATRNRGGGAVAPPAAPATTAGKPH
jgi:hypothetical protein